MALATTPAAETLLRYQKCQGGPFTDLNPETHIHRELNYIGRGKVRGKSLATFK